MVIEDVTAFKHKYCKHYKCFLYLIVINNGVSSARFSLAYTFDDQPFVLKEGEQIYLPTHKKVFLLGLPKKDKGASFNYLNSMYDSLALAKVFDRQEEEGNKNFLSRILSEERFEYKSSIDKKGVIKINQSAFERHKNPVIIFCLIPKFNLTKERKHLSFTVLSEEDKSKVSLDFSLLKLDPFHEK